MKSVFAVASGIAITGLFLAGCSSNSNSANDSGSVEVVAVTLTNKACSPDRSEVPAGRTKFEIKNDGGTKVSEVELMDGDKVLGEKEGLAPGFSGSFSATLKAGTYELYCPGADTPRTKITVTGAATP